MTWLDVLRTIKEEGAKAKRDGKSEHENPYSFTTETAQAYAWEDGYKSAR